MSTLKVTTLQDTAGGNSSTSAEIYSGRAKAWVNFDGTFGTSPFTIANGGIRAAFNVSSITDNGTGDYTVNFSNALPNTNYAVAGSTVGTAGAYYNYITGNGSSLTTGSVRILSSQDFTKYDTDVVAVMVFSS